ncbi:MAG: hypothetical protein AAF670_03445 [Planctomycetota bacterium]
MSRWKWNRLVGLQRRSTVLLGLAILHGSLLLPSLARSGELVESLRAAGFQRPTETDLRNAREQALVALSAAESYLRQSDPDGTWRRYLALESLFEAITRLSEQPPESSAELVRVDETLSRLFGNQPGLETPVLVDLRTRLRVLVSTHERVIDETLEPRFEALRTKLIQLLNVPATERRVDWFRQAAPIVSWMDEYDQAPMVIDNMKRLWSYNNLDARISASAMQLITSRNISEVEPIREVDDGRLITGRAVATGVARMMPTDLGPSECRIIFDGSIDSTLGGTEGPVTFRLAGRTRLRVEQPVDLSPDAFVLQPPIPASATNLWTDCVSTKRDGIGSGLIRKIATRMIEKEQPAAQRDLDRGSRERFVKQFQLDVADEMQSAWVDLQEDVIAPLDRLDIRPDDLHFRTSREALNARMTLNGGLGLGATSPPNRVPVLGPLGVDIHESVINQLAQRLLAGERLSNFPSLIESLGMPLEEETFQKIPDDVSIRFADERPITARFEDDTLEFTIRGRQYVLGQAVLVAMNARLRYSISIESGQLVLTRIGLPEVLPPADGKSGRFYLQSNVLATRLASELPAVSRVDGFTLPEPADRLGKTTYRSVIARNGWLQVQLGGTQ